MGVSFLQLAIVCPLALIGGFVDAVAGGGGFFTLTAYLLAGLPTINAVATNKLSSTIGTSVAAARYIRNGYVPLKLALVTVPCALLGSWGGAQIALQVSDVVFRWIMLCILPVTGFYVLKKKNLDGGSPLEELPLRQTLMLCGGVSLLIGVYDGFYGPGTGTFLILIFTGLAHLNLQQAAGTGKIVNLSTNLAALVVYLINGKALMALGLIAAVFSIAGNWLGSGSFSKKGNRLARPMVLVVLIIFFGKLLWELVGK